MAPFCRDSVLFFQLAHRIFLVLLGCCMLLLDVASGFSLVVASRALDGFWLVCGRCMLLMDV